MKVVRRITGLLLVAVLLMPLAITAEELSLDDCIDLALKNRAEIVKAMGDVKSASANKRAALGAFLPQIGANYSYSKSKATDIEYERETRDIINRDTLYVDAVDSIVNPNSPFDTIGVPVTIGFPQNRFGDPYVKTFMSPDQDGSGKRLSFSAQMNLFNLPNWFNYTASRANLDGAKLDVLASEQDMILAVKNAYFEYLAAFENVGVQEEAAKRAEEQLKLIQSRFELGSASKSDVLKQKVQYGNDQLSLLSARNSVEDLNSRLAYTIGVDPRQDWKFSKTYTSREYSGTISEALEFALGHSPRLLSADVAVREAGRRVSAAKSLYLPTLSASASYSRSSGTSGDTVLYESSRKSQSFGLNLSWNIFDGFSRERTVANAKIARNNVRAQRADNQNRTMSAVKTAYLDILRLREQGGVTEENVEAAEEDLKITQEKYNLGAATILDLLDAQVSLKDAQVQQIGVDFSLNRAIARLENSMGKM